jgi:DNA-binding helix-hairpin-helix protein with protein kinase domain
MVRESAARLSRIAAWPTALLSEVPRGQVVGFLMPRFDGFEPIHHLFIPARRKVRFPRADWSFLVHAARNCAIAFGEIHSASCLVGDVNPGNVLVSKRALVRLIDCDSFQVRDGAVVYPCEVGVTHYTPPEVQGRSFRGLVRTLDHDLFGLAVLVFQVMLLGRHPYAGRSAEGPDLPFDRAIRDYRFAFGAEAAAMGMRPPPFSLGLGSLSPDLATLCERAFATGSATPGTRPTASEWVRALGAFLNTLRPCTVNAAHKVPRHLARCPWCRIVADQGPDYFGAMERDGEELRFVPDEDRLAALVDESRTILRIDFAARPPAILEQVATPVPLPLAAQMARVNRSYAVVAGLGARAALPIGFIAYALQDATKVAMLWRILIAVLIAVAVVSPFLACLLLLDALVRALLSPFSAYSRERSARRRALEKARREMDSANRQWRNIVTRYEHEFRQVRGRIQAARESVLALGQEFERLIAEMKEARALLQSEPRGCFDAADGRELRDRLEARQERHFEEIRQASRRLLDLSADTAEKIESLEPALEARAHALAQAQADMEVLRR